VVGGTAPVDGAVPIGLAVLSRGAVVSVEGIGRVGVELDVELLIVKKLEYVFKLRPCTSRSALQAYSKNVVISTYS
jgi:hypothetical protein